MSDDAVYLITVNYYSAELVKRLLASLQSVQGELRLLVINNSPEDVSVNELEKHPGVSVIHAPKNLGFAAGCNLGIKSLYQQGVRDLLWLINPDATVEREAILYVKQCLQAEPTVAILGTKIRDCQGQIWFETGRFNPWLGSLKHRCRKPKPTPVQRTVEDCRWVSGCSLIFNLQHFDHCPQFDEHYFLYYEDADLCDRYYCQGYRIAVTTAVLVTHAVSQVTQKNQLAKYQHATYSKLYFLQQRGTAIALVLNLAYLSLHAIGLLLQGKIAAARGRWHGITQFVSKSLGQMVHLQGLWHDRNS